jgi:rSAM/selenodomain-associated transferase 2
MLMLASSSVISVIIPTHGEPAGAAARLADLRANGFEVVVVDGGSTQETLRAFELAATRLLRRPGRSRGARQDEGARASNGEILLFLHADSALPPEPREILEDAVRRGATAGCFRLAYERPTLALRWIAYWANLRTRLFRLPFGDQGIFCTRAVYDQSGGFRDLPICDDLNFILRLRKDPRFRVLRAACVTSPRRYSGRPARQVLKTWLILLGYFAGVPPGQLDRWYRR